MQWKHVVETEEMQGTRRTKRKYVLKISKEDRARVLSSYIDRISEIADEMKRRSRSRKLFSNESRDIYGKWSSVAFKNPSTFEALALEPSLKEKIKLDLDFFVQSRDFYRRTGRTWKREYLLYGPPGTGKSSLIAAIANYLNYDVYDLELTAVCDNSILRQLLLATPSKSVIVIEDIDCAADLPKRSACRGSSGIQNDGSGYSEGGSSPSSSISLSGLLNFADGLWSSCGEEKIMIFTTNHKERLDPALLRSGRMDMHILLSYCGFEAFKQLAFNYFDLGDHFLFSSVGEKMKSGGSLTPADICEILFQNKSDPDAAIRAVIGALDATISKASEEVIDSSQDEDEEKLPLSPSSSSSSSSEELVEAELSGLWAEIDPGANLRS